MQTSVWFYLFLGGSIFPRGVRRTTPESCIVLRNASNLLTIWPSPLHKYNTFLVLKMFQRAAVLIIRLRCWTLFYLFVLYRFLFNYWPAHNNSQIKCVNFNKLSVFTSCFSEAPNSVVLDRLSRIGMFYILYMNNTMGLNILRPRVVFR